MDAKLARLAVAPVAALIVVVGAFSQSAGPPQSRSAPPAAAAVPGAQPAGRGERRLTRSDIAFIKAAAHAAQAEIAGSRIAAQRAVDARLRAFAQQMLDEHGKSSDELKALAALKGVEVPDQPSAAQKARLRMLESSDAAGFDRRYAKSIGVDAHAHALALSRKAARTAKDPQIKAYAAKMVPVLERHLATARELLAAIDAMSPG